MDAAYWAVLADGFPQVADDELHIGGKVRGPPAFGSVHLGNETIQRAHRITRGE